MDHRQKMQEYLLQYDIHTNVDDFVSVTSNIYHQFEARQYDERHLSIADSGSHWTRVTQVIAKRFRNADNLTVLDFGCGTGFASQQLLQSSLNSSITKINCYDLSAEMIQVCREKFAKDDRFIFYADHAGLQQMLATGVKCDIIVCNALMHHVLDTASVLGLIAKLLKPEGIFVMGHEPNKNFYCNGILQSVSKVFRLYKRAVRKITKGAGPSGISTNIAHATHAELARQKMIPDHFPASIIPKFVDIHVPMSNYTKQPWGELGFDADFVRNQLGHEFRLVDQITYSHIKDQQADRDFLWKRVAGVLATVFPADGADAIFVFQKSDSQ